MMPLLRLSQSVLLTVDYKSKHPEFVRYAASFRNSVGQGWAQWEWPRGAEGETRSGDSPRLATRSEAARRESETGIERFISLGGARR